MSTPDKSHITSVFKNIQDHICQALEDADGKGVFLQERWERPGGGGGRSRVIRHGNIIEKGG